eukprot:10256939-Ditylum_brightwellii.AAC.1
MQLPRQLLKKLLRLIKTIKEQNLKTSRLCSLVSNQLLQRQNPDVDVEFNSTTTTTTIHRQEVQTHGHTYNNTHSSNPRNS